MTDNRANEPTAEQILVDEWIRQADRAKSMTGMDAIWFPDAEETLAVLRANGLLSEGTPSEQQVEWAARAFFREYHGEDIWPELRDDGELDTRSRALAATRAALVAAATTPQPVLDLEKVAALIESERDRAAAERDVAQESLGQFMARALCEAAKRGELS